MFLVALLAAVIETSAFAKADVEEEADAAGGLWSVGAGMGFSVYGGWTSGTGYGLAGLVSSYYGYYNISMPSSPIGKLLVERRLGESWALMFQLSGSYTDNGDSQRVSPELALSLSANLGTRWIINPGGAVEISPYVLLGGGMQEMKEVLVGYKSDGAPVYSDPSGTVIGLGVGLVLERKLIDNLFLRLESLVAEITYSHVEGSTLSTDDKVSNLAVNRFTADLAFTPSIQLRLTF